MCTILEMRIDELEEEIENLKELERKRLNLKKKLLLKKRLSIEDFQNKHHLYIYELRNYLFEYELYVLEEYDVLDFLIEGSKNYK